MEISVVKFESCLKQDPDEDEFESESIADLSEYEIEKTSHIDEEEDPLKIQPESKKCHKKAKFQCSFCTNAYSIYKSLGDHIRLKHREMRLEKNYPCPIAKCDRTFPTKRYVVIHVSEIHTTNHNHIPVNDQDGKFHCPFCPKNFILMESLYYHITSGHAADEKKHFECQICKDEEKCSKFFDQVCLNKHISVVHKPFKCPVCFLSFDISNFKRHKDTHLGQKKFQCGYCPKTYNHQATLKFHLIEKHNDKSVKMTIYKCELCDKIFHLHQRLRRHTVNVHNVVEKVFECSICSKKFFHETYFAEHVKRMHRGTSKTHHVCRLCSQEFRTKIDYDRHLGVEHGIFFDCRKCSLLFKTKREFDEHLKVVSELDSPELRCQICLMSLKNQCSLSVHEDSHLKQLEPKSKSCLPCLDTPLPKVVVNVGAKEEKPHAELQLQAELERSFKCDLCSLAFVKALSLSRHRKETHGNLPWECKVCGKKFAQRNLLVKHETLHSSAQLTPTTFKGSNNDLKAHAKSAHRSGKMKLRSGGDAFACALSSFETKDKDHREIVIHNNRHNLPKVTVRKIVFCPEHEFQITGTPIKRGNETVSSSKDKCPLCSNDAVPFAQARKKMYCVGTSVNQ